jgi:hypothetical protein
LHKGKGEKGLRDGGTRTLSRSWRDTTLRPDKPAFDVWINKAAMQHKIKVRWYDSTRAMGEGNYFLLLASSWFAQELVATKTRAIKSALKTLTTLPNKQGALVFSLQRGK